MMQIDEEMETQNSTDPHVTPCATPARKSLHFGFKNSGDSGFFSNTPSSEEQCCKSNILLGQYHDTSRNEVAYTTPYVANSHSLYQANYEPWSKSQNLESSSAHNSILESRPSSYSNDMRLDYEISPVTRINDSCHTSLYDSVLTDTSLYCDTSADSALLAPKSNNGNEPSSSSSTSPVLEVCRERLINNSCSSTRRGDVKQVDQGKLKERVVSADDAVFMDCEETVYTDVFMSDEEERSSPTEQDVRLTPKEDRKTVIPVSSVSPTFQVKSRISYRESKFFYSRKSLYEFEYVDVLYFLGQKENHCTVVSEIFSYLPAADLLTVSMVSKTWKQILQNDTKARKRLAHYKRIGSASKENMKTKDSKRKSGFQPFSDIQNIQVNASPKKSPSSPPSSPRSRRFKLFCKEGEKLDKKSKLVPCPRCTLPARCSTTGDNAGECLRVGCQYRFCLNCRADLHAPKLCFRISSCPVRKNHMQIGSKASKRRLSRT